MVRFFLSATPFYWGEYGVVKNLLIPCSSQYFMSSDEMNLPPRSDLTYLIGMSVSFSNIASNLLNTSNNSDFSFKNYTHVFLEKSSMKEMKYLFPLKDSGVIDPQMSV